MRAELVDEFTEEDLYGLRGVPWTLWRIAGAAVGVALAYLLLAWRDWFVKPLAGISLSLVCYLLSLVWS